MKLQSQNQKIFFYSFVVFFRYGFLIAQHYYNFQYCQLLKFFFVRELQFLTAQLPI